MRTISKIFYLASAIFGLIGFNKLWRYDNPDFGNKVNAYVGGDAYNYIINSNLSTSYFILAFIFSFLASTFVFINNQNIIIDSLNNNAKSHENFEAIKFDIKKIKHEFKKISNIFLTKT